MNPRELTNEELATELRVIAATGICPTRDERAYLEEAARRIEEGVNYDKITGNKDNQKCN